MKVYVPSIPDEGVKFAFSKNDPWFRGMVAGRLADLKLDAETGKAEVELYRTNENISLNGSVTGRMHPICCRCGVSFGTPLDLDINRHLVPLFALPKEKMTGDGDEVELSEEDLEFSFYRNDEIDLEDILAEEILLGQPITHLCKEDCAGLCIHCGVNLNEKQCDCSKTSQTSPFVVLKDWADKKR